MRQGSEAAVEYLAGLWKKELPFDLSWEVEPPNEGGEIPENGTVNANEAAYYIPTWSWASVGRPVTYRFDLPLEIWKYEPVAIDQCIVERVHCQHELLEDPMSAVTDGSIVLTSAFAPVKLIRLEGLPEKQKGQVIHEDEVRHYTFVQCSDGQKVSVTLDKPEVHNPDETYYCLRLFSWVSERNQRMGPETWFLILVPSTHKLGAFERRGVGLWDRLLADTDSRSCPIFEGSETATVEIV